jgi:chaperonin GroEL
MAKRVYYDDDVLRRLQEGVDAVANAVKVTLGPSGRNVCMERPFGTPQVTKDGVSVARDIVFDDVRKLGADAIKEASIRTAEEAGDGTTTSMVLAQALFTEARKAIVGGMHPIFIKRGMDTALYQALGFLKDFAVPVESLSEISKVAALASNGDTALGDLIAEAMEMVGKDGVIAVEESRGTSTHLEFSEGLQLDRGYLSFDFILEKDSAEINMESPLVFLADKRITDIQDVLPALEMSSRTRRPLLIVAHDLDGQALQVCVFNHLNRKVDVCAVKAPRIGEKRTQILENLAVLTGSVVVSDQTGVSLQKAHAEDVLGGVDSVKVTKDTTTFVGGHGHPDDIESHIKSLKSRLDLSGSEHDKEFYQQQMSQMSGGIAIIRVGASTEAELKEYKARVEDALSATQSAVRGGIVPGGGATLLQIADYLRFLRTDEESGLVLESMDEKVGYDIFVQSLEKPFLQIVQNAGIEPQKALYAFMQDSEGASNLVFDVRSGTVKDALEIGILDPARVVEQVLQNATSVASTLATSAALILTVATDEAE